jgi:hypothetical protein
MNDFQFCSSLIGKEVEILTNMTIRNMGHMAYIEEGDDPDAPFLITGKLEEVVEDLTLRVKDETGVSTIPKSYWEAISPIAPV